jgi:GntR family transcriptional regulator / MocR family aminotransferase
MTVLWAPESLKSHYRRPVEGRFVLERSAYIVHHSSFMAKRASSLPLTTLTVDHVRDAAGAPPLYAQLYGQIRAAILHGELRPGARLPSTRELARQLGVSRNTVFSAFEQLLAEGYLEGHTGSGTFVASTLPEELLSASREARLAGSVSVAARAVSRRGRVLADQRVSWFTLGDRPRALRPCLPALDSTLATIWGRLVAEYWRRPRREHLYYPDPAGLPALRAAVASYLGMARAVRCEPEQVIMVVGAQQAFSLASAVLLDPGDDAWIEEPGNLGARAALLGAGARLVPVPVDSNGLVVEAGRERCPNARLAYVTPSNQYPSGATMSLSRRLELIDWAARTGAWIVEDDYDSEFRYAGRPLAALHGLDDAGRVLYVGTFSKAVFPGLRLGYLVVPPDLVGTFTAARAASDCGSAVSDQAVLARFLAEDHFARHLRRMRGLYAGRQATLVDAVRREPPGTLSVEASPAGLHLVARLAEGVDDVAVCREAASRGVESVPMSIHYLETPRRSALVLGYAPFEEGDIRRAVTELGSSIRAVAPRATAERV